MPDEDGCTRKSNEALREELAYAKTQLANLDLKRTQAQKLVASLNKEIAKRENHYQSPFVPANIDANGAHFTSKDKIKLFQRLFRGRTDVYPQRWENPGKGTSGYSPACSNEWVRGICEKPRVRCRECLEQAFIPVTEKIILNHLQGNSVAGVYPLLPDETCWFLAVDFDKQGWEEDISAFRETCRIISIPVAVERSRSGNGAHAWFFFFIADPCLHSEKNGVLPHNRNDVTSA